MSAIEIQLPGQNIPIKSVDVKTDVPQLIKILKSVSSGKN